LISGPSSSGKTTFAKRLAIQLMVLGMKPVAISLDNYFVDREQTPLDDKGNYDFESLYALDLDLFNRHLKALLSGEEVEIPVFNFALGVKEYRGDKLVLTEQTVLILEGIHALNPKLLPEIPVEVQYKVYVSALTSMSLDDHNWIPTTDNRLLRRIIRDFRYRGYSAKETISRWESVREGEEKWIFPYQENADAMFNSAMIFEFSVLRSFAEPILRQVPQNCQEYTEADSVDFLPFRTGVAQITNPASDRWGTWISAEVPIKSASGNNVVAVLGMDYAARLWNRRLLMAVLESSFLVITTIILIILVLFGKTQNQSLKLEIRNREMAEDKLIQTDLRLSNLLKNLPGIAYRCALDKDYSMLFIGESCTTITGYTPEEFIEKKSISFNQMILPEYRDSIWEKWQEIIAGKKLFESEYPIKTASGEIKWLWERGHGVFDENGELQFLEGYIEDITDSKKNKSELIKAKDKAEESDRLKSAFLANISHEIRTPMNGILGFAELLKEPDLSPENQIEFLQIIETSGQRMLNIINDLIDISRIESGETVLRIRKTNVLNMLQELNRFFTPEAIQKGVQIDYSCNLDPEDYSIETDNQKLNQILTNSPKKAPSFLVVKSKIQT